MLVKDVETQVWLIERTMSPRERIDVELMARGFAERADVRPMGRAEQRGGSESPVHSRAAADRAHAAAVAAECAPFRGL